MRYGLGLVAVPGLLMLLLPAPARAGCEDEPSPGRPPVVTNTADSGVGSLRDAILNAPAGATIRIDSALCGGGANIVTLLSPLPTLGQGRVRIDGCGPETELVIDASAVVGAALTIASPGNHVCGLRIDGVQGAGISVIGGHRNVIEGNVITQATVAGIVIGGPGVREARVIRNLVGTDHTGAALGVCVAPAGGPCAGIYVNGAPHTALAENVVADTRSAAAGIVIEGDQGYRLVGNQMGSDETGTLPLANSGDGIQVSGARNVAIEDNVVTASSGAGLRLTSDRAVDVVGNAVGGSLEAGVVVTDSAGVRLTSNDVGVSRITHVALPNGGDCLLPTAGGVTIADSNADLVDNVIGANVCAGLRIAGTEGTVIAEANFVGVTPDDTDFGNLLDGVVIEGGTLHSLGVTGQGNTIAFNDGYGVHVLAGDHGMHENRLFGNTLGAIRVEGDQPAPPVITGRESSVVSGKVLGPVAPSHQAPFTRGAGTIEVFWSEAGQTRDAANFLGSVAVVANAESWSLDFRLLLAEPLPDDASFTATFTDEAGNTSALAESCDGDDQDQDGLIDEDFDYDGDLVTTCGYAQVDPNAPTVLDCAGNLPVLDCYDADLALQDDGDCDGHSCLEDCCDGDASVSCEPVRERCDGSDDDGDGRVDENFDQDGDGVAACGPKPDCDDNDPEVHPGAPEICGNGKDDDCDHEIDETADADGDGCGSCAAIGVPLDPNDHDPGDCGTEDADGDGDTAVAGDCDDHDAAMTLADLDGDGLSPCAGDCDDGDANVPLAAACPEVSIDDMGRTVHTITVNADGSFSPKWTWIHPGETVKWVFPPAVDTPRPVDNIVPVDWVGDGSGQCTAYRPFGVDVDDITGPQPHLASGIFAMGVKGPGYTVEYWDAASGKWLREPDDGDANTPALPACCAMGASEVGDLRLCKGGPKDRTLETTWADPGLTGVFMRLDWNDLEPARDKYDWSILDREVAAAVSHGKLYSIVVSAGDSDTPDWLFDGNDPVEKLTGMWDAYSDNPCLPSEIANPLDPGFQDAYFAMLDALAAHLKKKNAWYRALTYVKIAGTNTVTDEMRLPRSCDSGCVEACNTELWLRDPNGDPRAFPYRPSELYRFYDLQRQRLALAFPEKETAYMLIQDGYPQIAEPDANEPTADAFKTCLTDLGGEVCDGTCDPSLVCTSPDVDCPGTLCSEDGDVPGPTEQTEVVIARGRLDLEPNDALADDCIARPGNGRYTPALCPDALGGCPADPAAEYRFVVQHNGLHTASIDANSPNPNPWVMCAGDVGQPTGYQTGNETETVAVPADLASALGNMYDNTHAFFLEAYEKLTWQIEQQPDGALGANTAESLAYWAGLLHDRRAGQTSGWPVGEPLPAVHEHSFTGAYGALTHIVYVDGAKCAGQTPPFGVIGILP